MTVKRRHEEKGYARAAEFEADVETICANAEAYNSTWDGGDAYVRAAKALRRTLLARRENVTPRARIDRDNARSRLAAEQAEFDDDKALAAAKRKYRRYEKGESILPKPGKK